MVRFVKFGLMVLLILSLPKIGITAEIPKVFICQSYGPGEGCGAELEIGMMDRLKKLGYIDDKNVKYYHFYMDTQSKYRTPEEVKLRAEMALEEIRRINPDLLIVMDDNAFENVALELAKTGIPIVFGGVNLSLEFYDAKKDFMVTREHPGYNITGCLELTHSSSSNLLMKQIFPQAKKMAAITPDTYPFLVQLAKDFERDTKLHPDRYPIKLEKLYITSSSWEEYKKTLLDLNRREDIDIIYYLAPHSLFDNEKKGIRAEEVIAWTVRNITKPEYCNFAHWIKMGFLGGTGNDLQKCGEKQAVQVHRVLQGEKTSDIPIEGPEDFYIALNLARAQQLGIDITANVLKGARDLGGIYLEMSAYPEFKYKREAVPLF